MAVVFTRNRYSGPVGGKWMSGGNAQIAQRTEKVCQIPN